MTDKRLPYAKREPSGRWSFRRAYPANLRPFIPGTPRELKVSLGSHIAHDPGAMERYRAARSHYDRTVAQALNAATGSLDDLTPEAIAFLTSHFRTTELSILEHSAQGLPPPTRLYPARTDLEQDYRDARELLEERDGGPGYLALWGSWAIDVAASQGYRLALTSPGLSGLCRSLAHASCDLWLATDKVLDGEPPRAAPAPPARPSPPTVAKPKGMTLPEVATELRQSIADPIPIGTANAWGTALRYLSDALGPVEAGGIDRKGVTHLKNLMALKPSRLPAAERFLSLPDLAARYPKDGPPIRRMSPSTINHQLVHLRSIWTRGQKAGLIDNALANPFSGQAVRAGPKASGRSKTPTSAEVQAMLTTPVFTAGERPSGCRGEACYWLPLFMLWTGARPEEIAQLLVADFTTNATTGRLAVTLQGGGIHPIKGRQRLKTSEGARTFLVPKPLLDLGLPRYLSALSGAGEVALFPRLTLKRHELYGSMQRWQSAYLRAHNAMPALSSGHHLRGLRHFWTSHARETLPLDVREYIQGRAITSSDPGYGGEEAYSRRIDDFRLPPDLDLSRVLPWCRQDAEPVMSK